MALTKRLAGAKGQQSSDKTADNLFSTDVVEVLFGVSEGPIAGLDDGPKSFLVGDTPLQGPDGSNNFEEFELIVRTGSEVGEEIISRTGGFGASVTVSTELATNTPVVRSGLQTGIDFLEVRFAINRLLKSDDKGTHDHSGQVRLEYKKSDSSTWLPVKTIRTGGSTTGTNFERHVSDPDNNKNLVTTAVGDRRIFVQNDAPALTGLARTALWFDSNDSHKPYRPNAALNAWELVPSVTTGAGFLSWTTDILNIRQTIVDPMTGAIQQTGALTRTRKAWIGGSTPPTTKMRADIWINASNVAYVHNGSAWIKADSSKNPGTAGEITVTDGVIIITGKTTSVYAKEVRFPVDNISDDTYDLRVTKLTPANTEEEFFDITWESFQEVSAKSYTFPGLATTQLVARASEQFSSIPEFSGIYKGRIVRIPSNYNPTTRTYTGVWDGVWQLGYTNNPAFCANDLVLNDRYGMNSYYPVVLNKWDVYEAGQWCDVLTADGQPRFTFNAIIQDPQNGREAVEFICGIFGGRFFDDGNGSAVIRIDKDGDPVQLFSPENVVDGLFVYSWTDIATRFNDITVSFVNPDLNWQQDRRRVFDQDHIDKYGRIPHDFIAVGCTDPREAIVRARYKLATSITETRIVNFKTNRQGCYMQPYDIILIADDEMAGGLSGRVKTVTGAASLSLRDEVYLEPGYSYRAVFTVVNASTGAYETVTRNITGATGARTSLTFSSNLPTLPAQAVFGIETTDGSAAPRAFRVGTINEVEGDPDNVEITAIAINRLKWLFIDGLVPLDDIYDHYDVRPGDKLASPINLSVDPEQVLSGTGLQTNLILTWERSPSTAVSRYVLMVSKDGGAFSRLTDTPDLRYEWANVPPGEYVFSLRAEAPFGIPSDPIYVEHRLIGDVIVTDGVSGLRLADEPTGATLFTNRSPRFSWTPVTSIKHREYVVQVRQGATVKREVVQNGTEFIYPYDLNKEDFGGTPSRTFTLAVASRDQFGVLSTFSTLTVSNPAPAAPTIYVEPGVLALNIAWDQSSDADYAGTRVWVETSSGTVLTVDNSESEGLGQQYVFRAPVYGTYYVTVGHYDSFDPMPANRVGPQAHTVALPVFDNTAPAVPTGLALSSAIQSDGTIKLTATWNANAEADLAGYDLEVKEGAGNFVSFPVNSGQRWERTVLPNTLYTTQIRARDVSGNRSAFSATVTHTTTRDTTAPSSPANFAATGLFEAIWLQWDMGAEADLSHYELYEHTASTPAPVSGTAPTFDGITANSFVRQNLANGVTRHYWLRAVDTSGNKSNWTSVSSATTVTITLPDITTPTPGVPGVPTATPSISVQPDGTVIKTVELVWTAGTNAVHYELGWTPQGGNQQWIVVGALRHTMRIDPAISHSFVARSVNAFGEKSAASAAVTVAAGGDTTAPATPATPTIIAGFGFLTAVWGENTESDLAGYEVYVHTANTPAPTSGTTPTGMAGRGRFHLAGLTTGQTRFFWVRAFDRSGNKSAWSAVASGTTTSIALPDITTDTLGVPGTPTLSFTTQLQPDGGTITRVTASWTGATNAVTHEIGITESGSAEFFVGTGLLTHTFVAKAGVQYSVRARGVGPLGAKGAAGTAATITPGGDTVAPATPTGLAVTPALKGFWVQWTPNAETDLSHYELYEGVSTSAPPNSGPVETYDIRGTRFNRTGVDGGVTRNFWIRAVDRSGNKSAWSSMVSGTTVNVTAVDLDAVLAQTSYAASIEAPKVVSVLPTASTYTASKKVYLTTDQKIYVKNAAGTAWVEETATSLLVGQITDAQIAGLGASKVTGQLTNTQLADIDAAKITGQLITSQISDGSLTVTKFASTIKPVEILGSLPAQPQTQGRQVFLTTDNKLYRSTGSAWVASVASTDISGTITDAQLAALSASKITGQLTNSQIADLAAAKLTGQIVGTQITDDAITTPKLAAGAITSAKIAANTIVAGNIAAGTITATEIAAATITGAKIAAGTILAGNIAAGTITGDRLAANTITAGQIAANTITAGQIQAGAISTTELAAGAVTAVKIAANTITAGQIAAATITGDRLVANTITAAQIAAGTITAAEIAAGTITGAKIAAGTILAGNIASGTITALQIAAGTITGDRLVANTITAGQIAAGAVGADQIAANAIQTRHLVVTDFENLIPNPTFATNSLSDWFAASGSTYLSVVSRATSPGSNSPTDFCLQMLPSGGEVSLMSGSANYTLTNSGVPCVEGEVFHFSVVARRFGAAITGTLNLFAFFKNPGASDSWTSVIAFPSTMPTGAWTTYTGTVTVPAGASSIRAYLNWSTSGGAGGLYFTNFKMSRKIGAVLIQDGAIQANHLVTGTAVITGTAQIADAIITNAKVSDLSAAKLTAGTALAGTITVSGTALSTVESRAADPAARINAHTTKIDPGLITVSGSTTLSDWRQSGDLTKIAGGSISANTIDANKLTVGLRGVQVNGIEFEHNKPSANQVSWSAGTISYRDSAGAGQTVSIAASSATWTSGQLYVFFRPGDSSLGTTTSFATAYQTDRVILAVYQGGTDLVTNWGRTIIDGSHIKTGTVDAQQIKAKAIRTEHLVVTGGQNAINPDPGFEDMAIWGAPSSGSSTGVTQIAGGDTKFGFYRLDVSGFKTNYYDDVKHRFPIDPDKQYLVESAIYVANASFPCYGLLHFFDVNGNIIAATGWPLLSGNNFYFAYHDTAGWTTQKVQMGPGTARPIPAGARSAALGFIANYLAGASSPTSSLGMFRVAEMARGELIVDGSITATHVSTNQIITAKANIASAIIDTAHIDTISAAKLTASTAIAGTITVSGTPLSTVESRAADPAARINAFTTKIDPGLITVSGSTTIADWRQGGDLTKIAGGAISANTIDANKLTVGLRGVQVVGIEFEHNKPAANQVSWSAGYILYRDASNVTQSVTISAGNATWSSGELYLTFRPGDSAIGTTTSFATANQTDRFILAVYNGGTNLVTNVGRTIIDGAHIKTGTVDAQVLKANTITARELLLTNAANLIPNGNFQSGDLSGVYLYLSPASVQFASHSSYPGPGVILIVSTTTGAGAMMPGNVTDATRGIAVSAGEEYWVSADVWNSAAGNSGIQVLYANAAGATVSGPINNFAAVSAWNKRGFSFTVPSGAVRAVLYLYSDPAGSPSGAIYFTNITMRRRADANLIVDGAITAAKVGANQIITQAANIGDAVITSAKIVSLAAAKIEVGALNAGITVGATGVTIGTVESRAADPAARVNAAATVIQPGKVQISGATTLADWRMGGDDTKINGGSISANTITVNQLKVGLRGISVVGIGFEANRSTVGGAVVANSVAWTAGTITWKDSAGAHQVQSIPAGSASYSGSTLFVTFRPGDSTIGSTTAYATAHQDDRIILASYSGGTNLTTHIGQTVIDGDHIQTNAIVASKISAGAITADKLAVGRAHNMIENSDLKAGTARWGYARFGNASSHIVDGVSGWLVVKNGYTCPGGAIQLFQNDAAVASMAIIPTDDTGVARQFPVVPNARYEASCYVGTHRCKAYCYIDWYNSSGAYVSSSAAGTQVGPTDHASTGTQGTLGNFQRAFVFATAPATAASARVNFAKTATQSGSDSYAWFTNFQFAEASASQTEPSPYAPGAVTFITGDFIKTGAIVASHIAANQITTTHMSAGSINADRITAGTIYYDRLVQRNVPTDRLTQSAVTEIAAAINLVSAGSISLTQAQGWVTLASVTVPNDDAGSKFLVALTNAFISGTKTNSVGSSTLSWRVGVLLPNEVIVAQDPLGTIGWGGNETGSKTSSQGWTATHAGGGAGAGTLTLGFQVAVTGTSLSSVSMTGLAQFIVWKK